MKADPAQDSACFHLHPSLWRKFGGIAAPVRPVSVKKDWHAHYFLYIAILFAKCYPHNVLAAQPPLVLFLMGIIFTQV